MRFSDENYNNNTKEIFNITINRTNYFNINNYQYYIPKYKLDPPIKTSINVYKWYYKITKHLIFSCVQCIIIIIIIITIFLLLLLLQLLLINAKDWFWFLQTKTPQELVYWPDRLSLRNPYKLKKKRRFTLLIYYSYLLLMFLITIRTLKHYTHNLKEYNVNV